MSTQTSETHPRLRELRNIDRADLRRRRTQDLLELRDDLREEARELSGSRPTSRLEYRRVLTHIEDVIRERPGEVVPSHEGGAGSE